MNLVLFGGVSLSPRFVERHFSIFSRKQASGGYNIEAMICISQNNGHVKRICSKMYVFLMAS